MFDLLDIFRNPVLICGVTAWFIAQTLKVIITAWVEREFKFERFHGSGGMPSSHTAIIVSASFGIGYTQGFSSPLFALALIMSFIVMYDASGVRRSVGKQAKLLNDIINELFHDGKFHEEKLKELIGHKPLEVFAGAVLGILVALAFFWRF
ncbi:MAG: divergent PAP2 family protein [Bacillota bacterium]|nr:divergent PAP2 family protein [Bacillota bacterium]